MAHGTDKNETTKDIAHITTEAEMRSVQIHTALWRTLHGTSKGKHDGILHSTQYNQVSLKDLVMKGDLVFFLI